MPLWFMKAPRIAFIDHQNCSQAAFLPFKEDAKNTMVARLLKERQKPGFKIGLATWLKNYFYSSIFF